MAETFVIAQGGGPTAVINQTMVGATLEIRKRYPGANVLGSRYGVRGMRDGDFVNLSRSLGGRNSRFGGTPSSGARLHPRQARRRLLRARAQGPEEGRRAGLHLYRRQRHVRHTADPH